jgi:hypothetical protein
LNLFQPGDFDFPFQRLEFRVTGDQFGLLLLRQSGGKGIGQADLETAFPGSPLPAVVARGETGFPAEDLREMARVGVADVEGNRHHALLGFAEQAFRLIHPQVDVVVRGRYAHGALEQAMKMKLAQPRLGGQLVQAAPREAVRWDNGRGYQREINSLKSWIADRLAFIDGNFLRPPVFSTNGGAITPGFRLTLTARTREADSTIYYTLDGTDPRSPGGSVSPAAASGINTVTLTLTNSARVFARNWNRAHRNPTGPGKPPISSPWSGPTVAAFVVTPPRASAPRPAGTPTSQRQGL